MKQSTIFSNKYGIYELPKDLRNLGNITKTLIVVKRQKYQSKTSLNYSLMPSLSVKIKTSPILAKNCWKKENEFSCRAFFYMKTSVFLKYLVHDCLCKQAFASISSQTPLNLIFLNNFSNSKDFKTVLTKIRGTKFQKSVKIGLTW